MAKENPFLSTGVQEGADAPPKKPRFRDTWQGFSVFVVVLLVLRFLVFEPFKIPTGSMEPTLIGHEDYGDRIVTNKLAYKGGTNPVGFVGGDPSRFDVFVFVHDMAWQRPNPDNLRVTNSLKRNYIKRLVGLPGESLVISGGDLFLRKEGKESILRKWETATTLQDTLWQPVSIPELRQVVAPAGASASERLICSQKQNRAFPWNVEVGKAEFSDGEASVRLSGTVSMAYRYPVTNVYAKLGRWPFVHEDCPAVSSIGEGIQAEDGTVVHNPREKSRYIAPYMADYWSGVECPNCGQLRFPLVRDDEPAMNARAGEKTSDDGQPDAMDSDAASARAQAEDAPRIFPTNWANWNGANRSAFMSNEPDTNAATGLFFYGGNYIVGDLKLEVELEVEQAGGSLQLEVGSNLHRASWCLSLGDSPPALEPDEKRHDVPAQTTLAAGEKHVLVLAYVDGSVLSSLDDVQNEPVKIDVRPVDAAKIESMVRLRLNGTARIRITRLNLYRDLYYTLKTDDYPGSPVTDYTNDWENRHYEEERQRYQLDIPDDKFMALGDNSPSSVDSRFWGFVPRKNLVGRASFIFWPPSRWRIIR